jgi:phage shock protein A
MLFGLKLFRPQTSNDELADKIAAVERQVRMLELEWESTYDKLRSMLARFSKREQRETAVAPSALSADGNGSEPATDDIDRLIALRRGRR